MSQRPGGYLQQVDEQLVSFFSHQVGGFLFLGLETIFPMGATNKNLLLSIIQAALICIYGCFQK